MFLISETEALMSGISFFGAKQKIAAYDSNLLACQELFESAPCAIQQQHHGSKVADLFLKIFRSNPGFWSSKAELVLQESLYQLDDLEQRLLWQDAKGAYAKFIALPLSLKTHLSYAVWLNDLLKGQLVDSSEYGMEAIKKSPLRLGDPCVLPVIHASCGSLIHQLKAHQRQLLNLTCAANKTKAFFASSQEETVHASTLLATELCAFYRTKMLYPYIKNSQTRDVVFKDLSSSVLRWLKETKDLPILEKNPERIYDMRGAQFHDKKTSFSLYAPQAKSVCLLLTAFGREIFSQPMEKHSDGTWRCSNEACRPGQTYLYRITDVHGKSFNKVDPFSFSSVFVPETGAIESVVVDRKSFTWTDSDFLRSQREKKPYHSAHSILELHAKSWNGKGSSIIDTAKKLVSYCHFMGFTHVELYGLMQHFWRNAVSYQVSNLFSPHDSLGTYQNVKEAIQILHNAGIAVILDWIPAHHDHGPHNSQHFSASAHLIDGTDHLFAGESPWGTLLFDFAKPETKRILEASLFWWIDEFHIDGVRVDAVSQILKKDGKDLPEAIEFLTYLIEKVKLQRPGVVIIAEATDWNPRLTSAAKDGGIGFHFNWNVGGRIEMQNFLKTPPALRSKSEHFDGKLKKTLEEALRSGGEKKIMTYSHDDSDTGHTHEHTLFNLPSPSITDPLQRIADVRNYLSFLIFAPSWGHLLHMGDEFAQPESWRARLDQGQEPVDWSCLRNPMHKAVQEFVKDAIAVYKERSDFWRNGAEGARIVYAFSENSILAYTRGNNVVVHNFSEKKFPRYTLTLGPYTKEVKVMKEIINSDDARYKGTGTCINSRDIQLRHREGNSFVDIAIAPFSSSVFALS